MEMEATHQTHPAGEPGGACAQIIFGALGDQVGNGHAVLCRAFICGRSSRSHCGRCER
jgi:hypothetical protein